MFIFPVDLAPPLLGLTVERLIFNPKSYDSENHILTGSYVVEDNETGLWQAIKVKIDRSGTKPDSKRVEILKRGRWVKGAHTAIGHARKFVNLED